MNIEDLKRIAKRKKESRPTYDVAALCDTILQVEDTPDLTGELQRIREENDNLRSTIAEMKQARGGRPKVRTSEQRKEWMREYMRRYRQRKSNKD